MARYITSVHPQNSAGWFADRCGKLTGSKVAAIFGKRDAELRAKLKFDLAIERVTGVPTPGPKPTAEMRWGNTQEPWNRMRYEGETGLTSIQRGFMHLPRLAAGCSIDGEVVDEDGRTGMNEFKCPGRRAHYSYIEGGVLPAIYLPQVTHGLWITGFAFCDFQSFDPRLPANLQVFRIRHERDQLAIDHHERTALQFLAEVDDLECQMRERAA